MKKDMKILVAYDGSVHADGAQSEAVDLAKEFSGSIIVVYVADLSESSEKTKAVLRKPEEKLKKAGVKYELRSERSNNAPVSIVRLAEKEKVDLIAIGSRGIGGAKAWLLGSVSAKVVAEAPCLVIIAK